MSTNVKVSSALVALFIAALGVALVVSTRSDSATTSASTQDVDGATTSASPPVVRTDSNVLSRAADDKVTLVEFLDLECEACRAAYPIVEDLRERYEGRVTFVARYFPIPSHRNAMNAALAVQSAANQGQFAAMYKTMYETQSKWGESQESRADLFRTFAEDLGLDMTQYDADVADPATQERVEQDRDDGVALGVQGTPTFFLNGEIIEPASLDDFEQLLDDALAG